MPSGGPRARRGERVRYNVVSELVAGVMTQTAIAERYRVSQTFVSNISTNLEAYGTAEAPPTRVRGAPRKITAEMEACILEFLVDYPTALLDEVQDLLVDEFDERISLSTIGRAIARLKMTRKRVQFVNPRQDPVLREQHLIERTELRAEQVIAVDESACNERTRDRKWGWSMRGLPCRVRQPRRGSKRWSILPAMGINGYLMVDVFQGSFNAKRFAEFIERLLPLMTPVPGPRSVIMLDNASTHRSMLKNDALMRKIAAAQVELLWLPPYSPDLNPIEETFAELKNWMRKNREMSYDYGEWFEGFLRFAVESVCPPGHARGYFRNAGFHVDETTVDKSYAAIRWQFDVEMVE